MENEFEKPLQRARLMMGIGLILINITILIGVIVGVHQIFKVSNKIDERTAAIQKSMNCVVSLFTNPGSQRSQLAIQASIDNCTIIKK
jgi:hypothetical protein